MRDEIILKAFEMLKAGDQKGLEGLDLSEQEVAALEGMLEEDEQLQNAAADVESSNFSGALGSAKAAGLGLVEKASFDLFDEFMGGLEAVMNRSDLPWDKKYEIARDKWRQISDKAWNEAPVGYGAGAALGLVSSGVGAARLGLQGAKAGAVLGGIGAYGATDKDTIQEQLADTAVGTAAGPLIEKVGAPLVKGGAEVFDELAGNIPSKTLEMGKNLIGAGTKEARKGFRQLGGKIKNLSNLKQFKEQNIDNILTSEQELNDLVTQHIDDVSRGQEGLIDDMDNYLQSKGGWAFEPDDFSGPIKSALSKLRKEKAWTKTTEEEKQKLLNFIKDFKDRVLFGDEKTKQAYHAFLAKAEDLAEGKDAKEFFQRKISGLDRKYTEKTAREYGEQRYTWDKNKGLDDLILEELNDFEYDMKALSTGSPSAVLMQIKDLMKKGPSAKKIKAANELAEKPFEDQLNLKLGDEYGVELEKISDSYIDKLTKDLQQSEEYEYLAEQLKKPKTFKDALGIKRQLQDEIYTGADIRLTGPEGQFKGTISSPLQGIRHNEFKKILTDLDVSFRDIMDKKADKVVKKMGRADKWKEYRDELHNSLSLKEELPTIVDKKQLVDDFLSNRSAQVSSILKKSPSSSLQQKIQDHWNKARPEYEDYTKLRAFATREGEVPLRKQAQFEAGSLMSQNIPQNIGRRILPEITRKTDPLSLNDPQANYVVPRAVKEISHLPLMALGINDAIAAEELMHSFEVADDVSLERGLGELAPMMEGLYSPSPVQTSKGRARSAIVTRSGVEARIVDPIERKVIREDYYNNPNISNIDKAKKMHKLNLTEKLDLDIEEPQQQVPMYEPQEAIEMPPLDIYANLNEVGQGGQQ